MFSSNIKDYDLKIELAKCCNGIATVYLSQYIPNSQHVAVKKYRMDKASKEESKMICDEILTMRQFNHPNILSFHTAFVHEAEMHLVAPLMCFGSCKDTSRNCFSTGFPEIFVALILRDVLAGLEYIHRKGYIHRSIRASHILLCQTKAVISGFRESTSIVSHGERAKTLHDLAPFSKKSLNWLAPEVLEQNLIGYTEKSDIYSVGITSCELANGIEPYADIEPTFMFTEKVRGFDVPTLLDRSTCPTDLPENELAMKTGHIYSQREFSDEFHNFTENCLEKRPANRSSAIQLLSHAFFKQCRHTSILDQLTRFGLETLDYTQLRDESITLCNELADMNMNGNFEWDF